MEKYDKFTVYQFYINFNVCAKYKKIYVYVYIVKIDKTVNYINDIYTYIRTYIYTYIHTYIHAHLVFPHNRNLRSTPLFSLLFVSTQCIYMYRSIAEATAAEQFRALQLEY